MTVLTEGRHTAEFILTEANGHRSRSSVTMDESQAWEAGQVLGIVSASGEWGAFDDTAIDGLENAAGIALDKQTTGAGETPTVAVIERDCEVNGALLTWPGTADAAEKDAAVVQLVAKGIIVRGDYGGA